MTRTRYQENYSELYSHEINDQSRKSKALKTLAVLKDYLSDDLSKMNVLEVGCFTGEIGLMIAEHFSTWSAIDIDQNAIQIAQQRNIKEFHEHIYYRVMNAETLGFSDDSFDIIICSHVYEHVPHPQKMMDEIHRVLRRDGICYFAAGNRLVIMEPHYKLPFLTYLPKSLANVYLKLFRGRSHYYETHFSLFSLRKLVNNFRIIDYTGKVIREPNKFYATDMLQEGSLKQKVSLVFIRVFYSLSPTYIWVLRK